MAVNRICHGVVVTADVRENRPKMKLDNNRVFGSAISFPDGLSGKSIRLWRTWVDRIRKEHRTRKTQRQPDLSHPDNQGAFVPLH
jgi:hypothetical protein